MSDDFQKVSKFRFAVWKYLGAMFMEPKGPNGEQAVSFTRFLAIILFVCCLMIWLTGALAGDAESAEIYVPEGMLYTLWGLVGIKGARDVAIGLKRYRD